MVPVKSHILGADKTHFEAMPAVRERRASQGIRRIKKPVGPGWSRTVLATFFFTFLQSWKSGSPAYSAPQNWRGACRRRAPLKINLPRPGAG